MFHDFHQSWSIYIKDALNGGILPEGVFALVEYRAGPKEPDVLAVDEWAARRKPLGERGGGATLIQPQTRIIQKIE